MHTRAETLRQQEARARSSAALVLRFHAQLRDLPELPKSPAAPRPIAPAMMRRRRDADVNLGERTPFRSALAVFEWLAIGAVILATWFLFLHG
jgi:anti-sigma factor RsiW